VPCQEYHTIPIGPQIQVLYRDRESSTHGQYLCRERERVLSEIKEHGVLGEYSDVLHSLDMIKAFQDELVTGDDIVLLFSINGAQLYAQKSLACWIYIWVLLNLEPSRCYKKRHIFIGGFIPGPTTLKTLILSCCLGFITSLRFSAKALVSGTVPFNVKSNLRSSSCS
jgi:hypothetical protein